MAQPERTANRAVKRCGKAAGSGAPVGAFTAPRLHPTFRFTFRAMCALLMPSVARSGAIPADADTTAPTAPTEPFDASEDDSAEAGDEKLRSGIQSIEVGFR